MGFNIILIIIIILLLIILYINTIQPYDTECISSDSLINSIDGYWISNDSFNKESEIDNMTLYIDFNNYTADLVIIINKQIITNDKYNIYIDEDNIINKDNKLVFKVLFKNSTNNTIWNNKTLNCILAPLHGTIKMFSHDNILYGDFIKDNKITNFINNL